MQLPGQHQTVGLPPPWQCLPSISLIQPCSIERWQYSRLWWKRTPAYLALSQGDTRAFSLGVGICKVYDCVFNEFIAFVVGNYEQNIWALKKLGLLQQASVGLLHKSNTDLHLSLNSCSSFFSFSFKTIKSLIFCKISASVFDSISSNSSFFSARRSLKSMAVESSSVA